MTTHPTQRMVRRGARADHAAHLTLISNDLRGEAASALTRTIQRLPALTSLALEHAMLGEDSALELATDDAFGRLTALTIHECVTGESGLWALITSDTLRSLEQLTLRGIHAWDKGIAALGAAELPALTLLDCELPPGALPRLRAHIQHVEEPP